ncbi:ROK family transcriptional regulator [Nocardioides marmotae]|uniref:ROK family transcriptional regulator n=1 Tax=Nocardioides marmotae TaxID=2663857 RepID=UPI0012B51C62|nr:ROK family transcriptional regulator [Nocardioides marmotae]MBC9734383.1 ROK family transcriptional regulator [Nocardioides marmotae]MTB85483.1 ROK family protein [Nocardioides marmotae]
MTSSAPVAPRPATPTPTAAPATATTAAGRPTVVSDQVALRRDRLSAVLRRLRDAGPRSRARLAGDLGLNRSAASSLVAELEERGLVRPAGVERRGVGRPGTTVELDGRRVVGLGAEISAAHVSAIAVDLSGGVVAEHRCPVDVARLGPLGAVDLLAGLVREAERGVGAAGGTVVGLAVGVAGLLDTAREELVVAPNLGWRDVPLGALLRDRLPVSYPVAVDNDANLAATAEAVAGDPARRDVVVIYAEGGVGGGIVAGGRLLRGRHGYAGEFGHITVDPQGRRCACGRIGCWETVVGLRALLDAAADPDDRVHDPAVPVEERLAEIERRADLGDARTLAALDQVATGLGVGAAVLVNALNPAAVVLSGYFATLGRHLRPAVEAQLAAGVLAPDSGGTHVSISSLGRRAAVRGGADVALAAVYTDPTLVPRRAGAPEGAR